ncbi:MAG: O-antigen ligase family protein [Candidatus Terrybacteria bacterium]|nr:O-antigen ligase family protein [Candidatus Terrybacteria bacterium]
MLTLRLSYLFLAFALFAVALVAPSTFFPFVGVKAYWFRLWVSAAAAFLWWYGFRASRESDSAHAEIRERFRRVTASPFVWAVTAFVGAFLISTFLARDPSLAFWSNFERGEGGFAMLYLYAFFLLLLFVVRDGSTSLTAGERSWRGLLWVSLVAAVLVVGYGILAMFDDPGNGKYFMGPTGISGVLRDRFAGSLGNPIYVGSYLLFVFFFIGSLYENIKYQIANSKYKISNLKYKKWLLVALAAFFSIFFVLSQGRGAMAGLAAGLLAGLGFASWAAHGRKRVVALCILAALLLMGGALRYFKNSAPVRAVPIISRIARISLTSDRTRLFAWGTAWEAFQERPLFGWGPENFTEAFDRHFDIRHFTPGAPSSTWYDRAHSIIFDYLAELGAIGLAAFLSVFAVFYRQFFKFWDRKRVLRGALWFAFPVAYLTQGIAIFDIFPIYIQLFFFLAYAAHEFSSEQNVVSSK